MERILVHVMQFLCDSLVITLTAFFLQTYVNLKQYENNLCANVEDLAAE